MSVSERKTIYLENNRGYTLIELLGVMVILLIISAISIPNITRIAATYKLDASGHAVASLVQQARLQAVKTNLPAYVQIDLTQNPNRVYVNGDSTQAYVAGDPDVGLSGGVSFQNGALTAAQLSQLTAYLGGGNNVSVEPLKNNIQSIAFNARGLPCIPTGNPQVCSATDGGAPPAFVWVMRHPNGGWDAVTVTPAGRVKSWRMTNSSGSATASCGYAACWQ